MHIIFSADNNYAMPMAVAAHSALCRIDHKTTVNINIVDGGISKENIFRVRRVIKQAHPKIKITFHYPDFKNFSGVNVLHYSVSSLSRIMMPNFFDESVERVLYLDSDVVVEGNLEDLWEFDLGKKAIWAVQNGPDNEFDKILRNKGFNIQFPVNARYFNSGVLLVNMPQWRAQRISERTLSFLYAHSSRLSFPDQDALNVIVAGDWGRLEPRWNKQVIRIGQPEAALQGELGVLHYTSHKPWRSIFPWKGKWTFQRAYLLSGWNRMHYAILLAMMLLISQWAHHNWIRVNRRLSKIIFRKNN